MRFSSLFFTALALALSMPGCAGQECDFNSQCGERFYCSFGRCEQDCRMDLDCDPGEGCSAIGQCIAGLDSGPPPLDSGLPTDGSPPPPTDTGVVDPPRDSGVDTGVVDPPRDSGVDTGVRDTGVPTGSGRYLDRCSGGGDCASGLCVDDVGGTRMCSISCVAHRDCASEHVCVSGVCMHDDTGASCSTASPAACALGLCIGNSSTGTGHCTRDCATAGDCPAGFACADAGAARVCVDIEHGCSGASQCETGLCLSAQGCTAECRTAADCPRRFGFLPQYTCERAFGSTNPICVPPSDVLGPDPIGASCPAVGSNTCRSGACDTAAPTGPNCTQSCTQEGGCGAGTGCFPSLEDTNGDGAPDTIYLLCSRSGSGALGSPCSTGRQCDSGLCDTAGFCTRLCTDDALCPTGMRCERVAGFTESFCRR